jgi:hypothetical protein
MKQTMERLALAMSAALLRAALGALRLRLATREATS